METLAYSTTGIAYDHIVEKELLARARNSCGHSLNLPSSPKKVSGVARKLSAMRAMREHRDIQTEELMKTLATACNSSKSRLGSTHAHFEEASRFCHRDSQWFMASLLATKLCSVLFCSVLFISPPSVQAALPSAFCVRFLGLDPLHKGNRYINTDKSLQSKFAAANPSLATHVFGKHVFRNCGQ